MITKDVHCCSYLQESWWTDEGFGENSARAVFSSSTFLRIRLLRYLRRQVAYQPVSTEITVNCGGYDLIFTIESVIMEYSVHSRYRMDCWNRAKAGITSTVSSTSLSISSNELLLTPVYF